jgi:H+/gluconate symporter-like permease
MDGGTIAGIIIAIIVLLCLAFFYNKFTSSEYGYQVNYGGRKHYKNKFVEKSCMPMKLNIVLALIFAYIVYAMFYN